jgi:hypothetical protein
MITPFAHIAGIPVEETALSFGPVLLAGGGIAALKVREALARVRGRAASQDSSRPPADS